MRREPWRYAWLGVALALGCTPTPTPMATTDVPATTDGAAGDAQTGADAADAQAADAQAADAQAADAADDAAGDAAGDAPPACATGQTSCGGKCVDTAANPMHCGACGMACMLSNAVAVCAAGRCGVSSCVTGFGDCDGDASNGCEVNLNESAANCGACTTACTFANAMGACTRGSCGVGTCLAGFSDCDGDAANGCETATASSTQNCGTCGTACSATNGTAGCAMGRCSVASCDTGFGDCDMSAANGCEAALNTNTNCGGCGRACTPGTRCAAGECVSSCPTGTTYCADLQICVNLSADVTNCGMCGRACPTRANATSTCSGGECRIECATGFGDCNNNPADGCEVNLATAASNCGACGSACNLTNATAGCAAGACIVATCNAGYGNCDGNPANGCEVNLNSTVGACGACGSACSLPNATPGCTAGRCAVGACNAGSLDCDMNAENGCETSGTTNTNCGACGRACGAGTRCANGECVSSCPEGTTYCPASGVCADFATDTSNCGMCGTACPSFANTSPNCSGGRCSFACNAGFSDCDGNPINGCEANLGTSAAHCGGCNVVCNPSNAVGACVTGGCQIVACSAGYGDCDGNPANGCEVDLRTTATACGTCNNACRPSNGAGTCAMGVCGVGSCDAGFGNCDMNASNGCETALSSNANCGACGRACGAGQVCSNGACTSSCPSMTTYCGNVMSCVDPAADPLNCGGCGVTCPVPANAVATCAGSTCGITCESGFASCDNSNGNGCEVNLNTSTANCGRCGGACTLANATATCSAGSCAVATCALNFGNCDGSPSNGCEVNLLTAAANCGACGNACAFTNATPTCNGGACALGACSTGFGNCDRNNGNGCETALNTTANCGACGNRCGANMACSSGVCVSTCPMGTTLCSGACVTTATDVNNCGGCGRVCASYPNVVRSCMGGTCGGTCVSGYGDCDRNTGNGCETNLNSSVSNCGACGNACSLANATPVCATGTCAIRSCNLGFANCDGSASNGCEVNVATSNANCGACGRACASGQTCRLGVCRNN